MELKFNHKKTKVIQLIDFIEAAIADQTLKVGDSLPSINNLSKRYDVSRDTVFKALLNLKERGLIDSIHGKNYFVSNHSNNILLLLDEYTPFKEALYNILLEKLPETYKIDLWFHQYNKKLFDDIITGSYGRYSKYVVMNYDNEYFADSLRKIPKNRLLLIDFGKFEKEGFSYVCQDFDDYFYDALDDFREEWAKYKKLVFILNKRHKHPQSSKDYFIKFCNDNGFSYEILDHTPEHIENGSCFIVIKPSDVVDVIKKSKINQLKIGEDFGLIAYNENPFYEIIGNGISSIGIDWKEMGSLIADFILTSQPVNTYLKTEIIKRDSF